MLIHQLLEGHAASDPDKEAIVFHDQRFTYGDYLEAVNRVAANMVKLGVKRGDKVALHIGNRPEYVFCYLATISLGAAAVPVSTRFSDVEAAFVIGDSDSSFLALVPGFAGIDFLDIANKILPSLPQVGKVVVLGTADEVGRVPGALPQDALFGAVSESDLEALAKARTEVDKDDTAFLCYTSGSTGIPKAAELSHKNIVAYAKGQQYASELTVDDRLLLDIPVNHVGGNVMAIIAMLNAGGTLVVLDQFIPQQVLQTIQDEKVSVMGQVGAQYILLMMQPDFDSYDLSSVKKAVVSAAPTPKEVFVQVREKFGADLTNGYGLSEVCGAVTFTRVEEDSFERLSTSIGKANPGVEISMLGSDGKPLPVGQEGEISIKGDPVMKGYYNRPDETDLVMTDDGYFRTGDMGMMDDDGYIYILGRKKEMYIRGGENVYPPEVEEVLTEHPGVLFAAVVGVPDPVMGEEGRAYIVPMPGAEQPSEEDIKKWAAGKLAKYKVPRSVVFRESLPLTPLGKVMKRALYQELKGEEGEVKP